MLGNPLNLPFLRRKQPLRHASRAAFVPVPAPACVAFPSTIRSAGGESSIPAAAVKESEPAAAGPFLLYGPGIVTQGGRSVR